MSCRLITTTGRNCTLVGTNFTRGVLLFIGRRSATQRHKIIKLPYIYTFLPERFCTSRISNEEDNILTCMNRDGVASDKDNVADLLKVQDSYNGTVNGEASGLASVSIQTKEDWTDPCAGLDLDTNEVPVDLEGETTRSDTTKNQATMDDERFPLPSESLNKGKIHACLEAFYTHEQVKAEAKEHGIDRNLFVETYQAFKRNIFKEAKVDTDLYNVLFELQNDLGHVDDLLPFFLSYAKRTYPVLDCLEDLREISDFRGPPDLFPEARSMKRKIIFHAGPTNSGKTHEALQRLQTAKSGVYCGPLRLLASEVYQKTNDNRVPCDLLTGEERRWAVSENKPSSHLACTVEMCSSTRKYDCAVIDEIQLISESERGYAWTKALLGLLAPEIHVCGEPTAIDLVRRLVHDCGDEFEVVYHDRLTTLEIENTSLDGDFSKIKRGDCIIAFSQRELYRIKRVVESACKWKCAIVYGGLPPGTKVDQARRFNDPEDNCKVLVATDAVGMGLNLNIRRIVFSSMEKFDGKRTSTLSSSQVRQIAGRAGRYGTEHSAGLVTTLHEEDLPTLRELMNQKSEDIKEAGIAPTTEQVEMFSYQLPKASLKEIFDTFCGICQVSSNYFICSMENKKLTADIIENIPLNIRDRYTLCISPADSRLLFVRIMLRRYARAISFGRIMSAEGIRRVVGWPPSPPTSLQSMQELEALHESFDVYLWLSYRYPDIFVDREKIRAMQSRLQTLINKSLSTSIALSGLIEQNQSVADAASRRAKGDRGDVGAYDDFKALEQQQGKNQNKYGRKLAVTKTKSRLKKEQRTTFYDQQDSVGPEESRIHSKKRTQSLTAQLLQEKVLTRRQLNRLQEEWRQNYLKTKSPRDR